MKDSLRYAAGLLVLGALILAGRSWSDTQPAAGPRPQTRIAVVNLSHVVRSYDKFKTFQDELKKAVEPFQAKDAAFKAEGERLSQEAPTAGAARREEIEKQLGELKQAIESNKTEAQKALTKRQEEQLKILYEDVAAVVGRHARANGLDLVLHYNDAVDDAELKSAQNIARKMQAGGLMPIYAAPGMDISKDIIAALNKDLSKAKGG